MLEDSPSQSTPTLRLTDAETPAQAGAWRQAKFKALAPDLQERYREFLRAEPSLEYRDAALIALTVLGTPRTMPVREQLIQDAKLSEMERTTLAGCVPPQRRANQVPLLDLIDSLLIAGREGRKLTSTERYRVEVAVASGDLSWFLTKLSEVLEIQPSRKHRLQSLLGHYVTRFRSKRNKVRTNANAKN